MPVCGAKDILKELRPRSASLLQFHGHGWFDPSTSLGRIYSAGLAPFWEHLLT